MAEILITHFIIVLISILLLAEAQKCGPPPVPRGLRVQDEEHRNYYVGRIVFYECAFGFYSEEISGTSRCELLPGKTRPDWATPDITCFEECAVPRVMHGEIVVSFLSYHYRTRLYRKVPVGALMDSENDYYLICDASYRPMGEHSDRAKITCKDKKWLEMPECIEAKTECDPLNAPEHGTIMYSTIEETKIGSIALFACDPGYTLEGSITSKCFADIGWVFPTPKCKKKEIIEVTSPLIVEQPPTPEVPVNNPEPPPKDEPEITTAAFTEKCNIPEIANGDVRKVKGYRPNGSQEEGSTEFQLRCRRGYEPLGQAVFVIKLSCIDGRLSPEPKCLPAKCHHNPPSVENGYPLRPVPRDHNGIVPYGCNQNYEKITPGNISCRYGQWTGRLPECRALPSPSPPPSTAPPPPPSTSPQPPQTPLNLSRIIFVSPNVTVKEFSSMDEFEKHLSPIHKQLFSGLLTNILDMARNNSFNSVPGNNVKFHNFTIKFHNFTLQ